MFAYVRGELLALERAHIESHVARCRSCAGLEKKCARSLEAAGAYAPKSEAEHVDRLKKRLRPYVAAGKPSRPSYVPVASLAAAAFAAVTALVLMPARDELPVEQPVIAAAEGPSQVATEVPVIPLSIEPAVRHELGTNLHVIAAREWDGRVVSNRPADMRVEMKTGFAVMAFKGGAGRKLTVIAPNVEVEVVGTKFFVHVLASGQTAVGVVSGSVRVYYANGNELVEAGGSRAFGAGGASVAAESSATPAIDLEDPFIEDHGHEETAELERTVVERLVVERPVVERPVVARTVPEGIAVPKARMTQPAKVEPTQPESQPVAEEKEPEAEPEAEKEQPELPAVTAGGLLSEAERLVSAGRIDEALHLYEWALASEEQAIREKRSLYRYELARLLGFEKNERAKARDIFEHLSITAEGEVRTQSAFALCELELSESACNAATCLRSMANDRASPKSVAEEANRLLARWKLTSCR
jgi:hypothetical protein